MQVYPWVMCQPWDLFVLGLVITLMAWFFTTAVVNLISKCSRVGNGPGLPAALLPCSHTDYFYFDFGITFLGLGAFIGGLVSLAGLFGRLYSMYWL